MEKRLINKRYLLTVLFIISIIAFFGVASATSSLTVTSNVTNGSTWFQGGANVSFNFTIGLTGANSTTNLTQINFTNANFTLNQAAPRVNSTNWTCTAWNSTLVNCSSSIAVKAAAINITIFALLPTTVAEINHTWFIQIADNFTANYTNTTWRTEVDYIPPTVTLPVYTNGTAKKNTDSLTLNISIPDTGSGVGYCRVNINGTNQTITPSDIWCNFTVGNLTTLGDANQSILVYANDSVGNLILNNTYVVEVDTTAPSPSPHCSPTTVNTGDSFPCTCSGTDATAGVNDSLSAGSSNSPDGISTPANTGHFTYSCSVTDYAGNTNSGTTSYSINLPPSTSHPNGGSSVIPSTDQKTISFASITPENPAIITGFTSNMGIKEIQIDVAQSTSNVKVTVQKYDTQPTNVSTSKTGAYKYIHVDTQNLVGKLSKATITIQVLNSWISQNSLTQNDISLFKYNENTTQWNELTTIFENKDANYSYYTVDLTSFSYFAIASNVQQQSNPPASGEQNQTPSGEQPTTTFWGMSYWIWIGIGLVILAIAIWVVVSMSKKKK